MQSVSKLNKVQAALREKLFQLLIFCRKLAFPQPEASTSTHQAVFLNHRPSPLEPKLPSFWSEQMLEKFFSHCLNDFPTRKHLPTLYCRFSLLQTCSPVSSAFHTRRNAFWGLIHTGRAMQRKTNGTCVHEWECSHCTPATSKGLLVRVLCGWGLRMAFVHNQTKPHAWDCSCVSHLPQLFNLKKFNFAAAWSIKFCSCFCSEFHPAVGINNFAFKTRGTAVSTSTTTQPAEIYGEIKC